MHDLYFRRLFLPMNLLSVQGQVRCRQHLPHLSPIASPISKCTFAPSLRSTSEIRTQPFVPVLTLMELDLCLLHHHQFLRFVPQLRYPASLLPILRTLGLIPLRSTFPQSLLPCLKGRNIISHHPNFSRLLVHPKTCVSCFANSQLPEFRSSTVRCALVFSLWSTYFLMMQLLDQSYHQADCGIPRRKWNSI